MIKFYKLEAIHTVHFTFAGAKFFDIKILNKYDMEINYPKNEGWDNFVPLDSDHIEVIEEVEEGWTVKVTKAIESGSNPLPIPAKIVRTLLKENQQMVYIFYEEYGNAFIVDLRRGRSRGECYLTMGWYQYVKDKKLKEGDTLEFKFRDSHRDIYANIIRG